MIRQIVADGGSAIARRPRRAPAGVIGHDDSESDSDDLKADEHESDTSSVATDTSETSLTGWREREREELGREMRNTQSRSSNDPPRWIYRIIHNVKFEGFGF